MSKLKDILVILAWVVVIASFMGVTAWVYGDWRCIFAECRILK